MLNHSSLTPEPPKLCSGGSVVYTGGTRLVPSYQEDSRNLSSLPEKSVFTTGF